MRDLLAYNPDTGVFTWKVRRTFTAREGTQAGGLHDGYVRIKVRGKEELAHRLAWRFVYGEIPEGLEVDHINGVRADNRICNLRLVNALQQRANAKLNRDNTSGYRGVYWSKRRQKWRAYIQRQHLGYFTSREEAAATVAVAFDQRFGAEYRRAEA